MSCLLSLQKNYIGANSTKHVYPHVHTKVYAASSLFQASLTAAADEPRGSEACCRRRQANSESITGAASSAFRFVMQRAFRRSSSLQQGFEDPLFGMGSTRRSLCVVFIIIFYFWNPFYLRSNVIDFAYATLHSANLARAPNPDSLKVKLSRALAASSRTLDSRRIQFPTCACPLRTD